MSKLSMAAGDANMQAHEMIYTLNLVWQTQCAELPRTLLRRAAEIVREISVGIQLAMAEDERRANQQEAKP